MVHHDVRDAMKNAYLASAARNASAVQKMFSSHPDSEKRAAKMKEKADRYSAEQQ